MTKKKNHVHIPKVPYSRIKGSGKNIVAKDFMKALKCANKIKQLDECIAVLVRAKDNEGKWYYSIGITGLDDLQDGSEIVLPPVGANGIRKLTVSKDD